jgi:hypothetical protein
MYHDGLLIITCDIKSSGNMRFVTNISVGMLFVLKKRGGGGEGGPITIQLRVCRHKLANTRDALLYRRGDLMGGRETLQKSGRVFDGLC